MNTTVVSFILISVAIAMAAIIISVLLKLIFFLKQKDTYRHILKFGLLGEIVGLLVVIAVWKFSRQEINSWADPESIIAIPFYSMLIGLLIGLFLTFRNR